MTHILETILASIPLFEHAVIASMDPLKGGLTNTSYLVQANCQRYVLRIAGEGAGELGINRQTEAQALQRVTGAGIAPEVVWYDPETGDALTCFVDGREFTPQDFTDPAIICRVAQLLRRVHSLPAIEGVFAPYQQIEDRLAIARTRGMAMPAQLERIMARLHTIEAERAGVPPVLCHGDPFHNNFIDADGRLYLIDWEFAGMCDPYFDLAAATYFCTPEQKDVMLDAYFGTVTGAMRETLAQLWYVVALWNATWAVLQNANGRTEFDYAGMADTIFKRLAETL